MDPKLAPTVFVGGPIQYASRHGEFSSPLKTIIEGVLDSLQLRGATVLSAHRYESYGEMDVEGMHNAVAARDFAWMNQCDVFVAILPDNDDGTPVRTDGTCVELGWASALRRPIVVVRSLTTPHSHLVKGLSSVTAVVEIDISDVVGEPALVAHEVFQLSAERKPLFG